MAHAIHRFKYEDHPELAGSLAPLMLEHLPPAPFALVPLPLHVSRLRMRRFDQAALLAQALAHHTRAPVLYGALLRRRATTRQVGLSEAAREANVQGAFEARARVVGSQNLVLVDDVFTTGATARAASRALLEKGARCVDVVTVARAYGGET